ncbi:MAG: SdrD B-like domain-containing protein, partial [Candidatus Omnitrophota bacterium]
ATTPQSPEVEVVHAKVKRVNFGLTTRTEISGLVFHDKNGNGVYEAGEDTIKKVVIILDGKEKALSSRMGEYMFRKMQAGEHTITLDLKSIPIQFIPKVPVSKKIKVAEGATFVYNIPLQEVK